MSIESIEHIQLKNTIISMQNNLKLNYYGYFALYFKFIKDNKMPAPAGVRIKNKQLEMYYNTEIIDEELNKYGKDFLYFLVIHEINHILLNHIMRANNKIKMLSNITQDMLINTIIKTDYNYDYSDNYYYVDKSYKDINYDCNDYNQLHVFEYLYDYLFEKNKNNIINKIKLVDKHFDSENMSEDEMDMNESIIKEIHESLKSRGFESSNGIEKLFKLKKKKSIVNVFKKVFNNGILKYKTYKKISKRHPKLKGKSKKGKDINIILDTSGSLYDDLDNYIGHVMGNYNIYLIQIDTSIKYQGFIKNIGEWKKLNKCGGGGTTLQPAVDKLIESKRSNIPTILISDFYSDQLNFSRFKAQITFVKSKDSTDPNVINCKNYRIIEGQS